MASLHSEARTQPAPSGTHTQGKLKEASSPRPCEGQHSWCPHFLGIPFAKPPVSSLCFLTPEAPEPCSAVIDGTSYPAMPLAPVTSD
ncbi:hypothetical protein A6R68_05346, partial [Neotoma lepida]